jgi:large subunit ribosomal protein L15
MSKIYEIKLTDVFEQPNDLEHSGLNVVLTHTMYAIVGAIALERGGVEANKFARQRILAPQGLGSN